MVGGHGVPAGHPSGRHRRRWLVRAACLVLAVVSGTVLGLAGYGWYQYRHLSTGLLRSDALAGLPRSTDGATNVLIIGLDSRLDQRGQPLPPGIYDALHAGDEQSGGYNANVLMLLHIPAHGGRATSISIPRDDLVDLPGEPSGMTQGKIKQAYGFAVDERREQLRAQGVTDPVAIEQLSRDAGRREQVATVRRLLGGVPIDHFVEVTMVAFYQLAQVVAPITVCLNRDTSDSYSGADFRSGYQQISAEQAVAFVRQRRDPDHPAFTDLDRERRQQAFLASLAHQLKQSGTFTDPSRLGALVRVAEQNVAVDHHLDLRTFASQAAGPADGEITFVTLPITGFDTDELGQDVNTVDVPAVQAMVRDLIGSPAPHPASGGGTPSPAGATGPGATDTGGEQGQSPAGPPSFPPLSGGAVPCVD